MEKKLLVGILITFLFLAPSISLAVDSTIFKDDFTGGIKSEWYMMYGSWAHNATLDAYSTNQTNKKNKLNLNYSIPDDNYVEFKVVDVANKSDEYFDLLTRTSWNGTYESGYAISYVEAYSNYYNEALLLTVWKDGVRKAHPDSVLWSELDGYSDVTDFEGSTIGISVQGNTIEGYLDGNKVLNATKTNYTNGTAGVISNPQSGVFTFDDFVVKESPPVVGNITGSPPIYDNHGVKVTANRSIKLDVSWKGINVKRISVLNFIRKKEYTTSFNISSELSEPATVNVTVDENREIGRLVKNLNIKELKLEGQSILTNKKYPNYETFTINGKDFKVSKLGKLDYSIKFPSFSSYTLSATVEANPYTSSQLINLIPLIFMFGAIGILLRTFGVLGMKGHPTKEDIIKAIVLVIFILAMIQLLV